jgi:hypothetical protein
MEDNLNTIKNVDKVPIYVEENINEICRIMIIYFFLFVLKLLLTWAVRKLKIPENVFNHIITF